MLREEIPVPDGYRIELYGQEGAPGADEVLALWDRNAVVDESIGGRRVHETLLVAIGPGDELVGTVLVHLEHSEVLHLSCWQLNVYVDRDHRRASVATALVVHAQARLAELHASGADRRAAGVFMEIQHQQLRVHRDEAQWNAFEFVGQTAGGHKRWVHYFGGVRAPEPPTPAAVPSPPARAATIAATPVATGPVFVVAAPGSGSEALRDALAGADELDLVDAEVAPGTGDRGARLDAGDATGAEADALREALAVPDGRRALAGGAHDALRVPLLHALFPDATFVYLYREPLEAVAAAIAGWERGDRVTAPALPGWDGPAWSYALIPRWRALRDAPPPELVAAQWAAVTRTLVTDLQRLPAARWSVVDQAALSADPAAELTRLARFAGLRQSPAPDALAAPAGQPPADPPADVEAVRRLTTDAAVSARVLFAEVPGQDEDAPDPQPGEIRASTTQSLGELLAQAHVSVLVSAPEADAVAVVRRVGREVNTHVARLGGPAGIAARPGRLAVALPDGVAGYRDMPGAGNRLPGSLRRDACFVPHRFHHTGDVGAGELAWAGGELWLASTRFSCLATLDDEHSFVPRWKPPFVTVLAAEDRCHLSGLCVAGGEVRYVTAFGATDTPRGWEEGVESGGVVVDARDGRTVASGLALPRSPRWQDDRLWVLMARAGELATVDPADGAVEVVARVPGYARGLVFHGGLAFVGVSALDEAAAAQPKAGVWVIDVASGQTAAYVEFTAGVTEVADVQLLPGVGFPEIVPQGSDAARNSFLLP